MSKYKNKFHIFEGIEFKSNLEKRAYQIYTEAGFNPQYEPIKYELMASHRLSDYTLFYKPHKMTLQCSSKVLRSISYTPDFIFTYKGIKIIVDTKGKPNETYPLKLKLFLAQLDKDENTGPVVFFEPHSVRQIKQSVEIIKNLTYHK